MSSELSQGALPQACDTGQSCLEGSEIFHPTISSLRDFLFSSLVKFLLKKSEFVSSEQEKGLVHPEAKMLLSEGAGVREAAGGGAGASMTLSE